MVWAKNKVQYDNSLSSHFWSYSDTIYCILIYKITPHYAAHGNVVMPWETVKVNTNSLCQDGKFSISVIPPSVAVTKALQFRLFLICALVLLSFSNYIYITKPLKKPYTHTRFIYQLRWISTKGQVHVYSLWLCDFLRFKAKKIHKLTWQIYNNQFICCFTLQSSTTMIWPTRKRCGLIKPPKIKNEHLKYINTTRIS